MDSAKKKPHKRLVPGGVAERLRRLVQRGRSEVTFWEHRTRTLKEEDVGEGMYRVESLALCGHPKIRIMFACNRLFHPPKSGYFGF